MSTTGLKHTGASETQLVDETDFTWANTDRITHQLPKGEAVVVGARCCAY